MRVQRLFIALVLALSAVTLNAQTWSDLEKGNDRFIAGTLEFKNLDTKRVDLRRDGQHPNVTILSCADSRVPPELLFDQSLGRLFIVRVAGNIADTFATGSIEYAVLNGWAKTLIVLGHEKCGAVQAAMGSGNPAQDALSMVVERIRAHLPNTSDEPTAIKANAQNSKKYLLATSVTIRNAATRRENPINIFAAYYDMTTGKVTKLP